MSDPSRHARQRGTWESILRKVPGFKGYLDKEYRRNSDHLTRAWIAERLEASKPRLDEYLRHLVDAGNLDALPACERFRSRLDATISRVRGAARGYSGFFDYVSVDERLLEEVYLHDLTLVDVADELAEGIERLPKSGEAPATAIPALLEKLEDFDKKFANRGDLLKGLGPDGPRE